MLNDNYNFLDKLIHKIILNNNFVGKSIYSLEKYIFLQTEDNIKKNKHIFISGLARSGSTLLLNLLHESNFFCSLTYSDMPFILAPNLWSKFNLSKKRNLEFINRAHSDLINISIHSPESFEEVFWKSIQNNNYITTDSLIKISVNNKHLKEYQDFISLICFKYSKKNYLTKNNNSILRLKEILSYFDNSFFLIPFRYPSNHVGSLINQHKRFKKIQKENNFTRKYMNWLGHYEFGFQRNQDHPLESELVIIDECSMIDTLLMDALLDAIPSSERLVLVGDVDQLPSVGPGMVLRDLIDSETINVVRLERIFRQSEESLITSNAHNVRLGHLPELPKGENSGNLKDFYFIRESDPEQIVGKIIQMVSKNIPDRFGFNPFQDIQVLTPMHAGVTGTINLNRRLQSVLNPDGAGFEYREQWFKIGDKLMQQQNDYEKQVFNGDMGRIAACDPKSREVHVEFDQGTVRYSAKEIDQLALAYAITVHKSQGSEYPAVIIPLTTHHYMMLQRNVLYTALTRGKKLIILIGMEKAIAMAVKNKDKRERYTGLKEHFREMKELMG